MRASNADVNRFFFSKLSPDFTTVNTAPKHQYFLKGWWRQEWVKCKTFYFFQLNKYQASYVAG